MEKNKEKMKKAEESSRSCNDKKCPKHGTLALRGRTFEGYVTKKFKTRVVIEFERPVKIRKYDRYAKKMTKLHAHLPECMAEEIVEGNYIRIKECRPISKIIHFAVTEKIREE